MGILNVSKLFAESRNIVTATVSQHLGFTLDEAAIFQLHKLRKFALTRSPASDAYVVILTTPRGTQRQPLRNFIPAQVNQLSEAVEIEVLTDLEGDLDISWELQAMNAGSLAMECSMNEALLAVMNAIIHANNIGAHIEFGQ